MGLDASRTVALSVGTDVVWHQQVERPGVDRHRCRCTYPAGAHEQVGGSRTGRVTTLRMHSREPDDLPHVSSGQGTRAERATASRWWTGSCTRATWFSTRGSWFQHPRDQVHAGSGSTCSKPRTSLSTLATYTSSDGHLQVIDWHGLRTWQKREGELVGVVLPRCALTLWPLLRWQLVALRLSLALALHRLDLVLKRALRL